MHPLPKALGAGTLVLVTNCTLKSVCTLLSLQLQIPLPQPIKSMSITMFNNVMTLDFVSVLWKTQMVATTLQAGGHCHLHPGQHSTESVANIYFIFLNIWDQTQYLSVSDSLRLLALSVISLYTRILIWVTCVAIRRFFHPLPASQVVLEPRAVTVWSPCRNK